MLPLDSPRWSELRHAYGQASDAPEMIRRVIREPSDEAWDALFGCLLHQGDVYTATYAAVPHLLEAATHRPHGEQVRHWSFIAGVAVRQVPDGLDPDVHDAYQKALEAGRPALLRVLEAHRFSTIHTLYLLGAAAALHDNRRLAWALEGLADEVFDLQCPSCGVWITIEPDSTGRNYGAREADRSGKEPLRATLVEPAPAPDPAEQPEPGTDRWLLHLALCRQDDGILHGLRAITGRVPCPRCSALVPVAQGIPEPHSETQP